MVPLLASVLALSLAIAAVQALNLPPIPADKTTPVQQRLAFMGPDGEYDEPKSNFIQFSANVE